MKIPKGGLHNINQSSQANINDSWNVLATDENNAVLIAVDKCGTKKTVGDTSNYMRLDGTEEGKEATGIYEFVQSVGGITYKLSIDGTGIIFTRSDSPNIYTYITKAYLSFSDGATNTSYVASGIISNKNYILLDVEGENPSGLRGDEDYSANITDLDYTQKIYVDNLISTKQDELVSGSNIKTINGTSVLGSGNITINNSTWGSINGTLSSQADLQNALNSKQNTLSSFDESLLIESNGNIESNVSLFTEYFNTQNCILGFTPIQILGVYKNGLKLLQSEYTITLPKTISINTYTDENIEIQYTHLKK